ncbi:MAG: HAD family hydrolase [bacterium]
MAINSGIIKALFFDYGNTLVEYGPRQVAGDRQAMVKELTRLFGPCDFARVDRLRDKQYQTPYKNGFHENKMRTITRDLVEEIYGITPCSKDINELVEARVRQFTISVNIRPGVIKLLRNLSVHYSLALVSNYPAGKSIRQSLKKLKIFEFFKSIVISGEVHYIKPHPKPFNKAMDDLGITAPACLFIGDNWLADIQGAKKLGMQAVLTSEYIPYDKFGPLPGDLEPDAKISNIFELEKMLI